MSLDEASPQVAYRNPPEAWRGLRQWRVLSTEFGQGQSFLDAWAAWQGDPDRPGLLHWCALAARAPAWQEMLHHAPRHAAQLAALQPHWHGLLTGFHRITLEHGQVLLTLCIGDPAQTLRQLGFTADCVHIEAPAASTEAPWSIPLLKALARISRRDTRLTVHPAVAGLVAGNSFDLAARQCGFVLEPASGRAEGHQASALAGRRGSFAPAWEPRRSHASPCKDHPLEGHRQGRCVVVGAGLAGAAVAHSMASRGWQVLVLDAATHPAAGASGLPAGLVGPHMSPDDSVLSQLSRVGLRITLQHAQRLLAQGQDWSPTGILEHRVGDKPYPPWGSRRDASHGQYWTTEATPDQLKAAHLPAQTLAWWHAQGAWIKPAALVRALLRHPHITFQGDTHVQRLARHDGTWSLHGLAGTATTTIDADLVVLAAAHDSQRLLEHLSPSWHLPVQPVRGQASWACTADHTPRAQLPPFPVNGHGSFIAGVPSEQGRFWIAGASFERDESMLYSDTQDIQRRHRLNADKLQVLLPHAGQALRPVMETSSCQAFVGIRCASPDRLPVVGHLGPSGTPGSALDGLCVSTAMGSRGLTFAVLCAELLAAQLHGEPLPLEQRLARAMDVRRFGARRTP